MHPRYLLRAFRPRAVGTAVAFVSAPILLAPAVHAAPPLPRSADHLSLPDLPRLHEVRRDLDGDGIPDKPELRGPGLLVAGLVLLAVGGTTAGVAGAILDDNLQARTFRDEDGALVAAVVTGGIMGTVGAVLGTIGGVQLIVSSVRRGNWDRRYGPQTQNAQAYRVLPLVSPRGDVGAALAVRF